MISRRTEAEARRICERGMAAYISDRHSVYLNRSLAYGVVGGIIPASLVLVSSAFMPINKLWALAPVGLGLVTGFGYGTITSDREDPIHEMEFTTVCETLNPTEEEQDDSDLPEQQ